MDEYDPCGSAFYLGLILGVAATMVLSHLRQIEKWYYRGKFERMERRKRLREMEAEIEAERRRRDTA